MKHWALTIFSICIQASIGIMLFAGINNIWQQDALNKTVVVAAGILAVIGLVASLLHLGRPLLAVRALSNFGTSWLSREVWLTSAFAIVSIVAVFLMFFQPEAEGVIFFLVMIAGIIGLVDVVAMAFIYMTSSVSAWKHKAIVVEFYAATLSMGAVLFWVLKGELGNLQQVLAFIVAVSVAIQVVAMVIYYLDLGSNSGLADRHSIMVLRKMNLAMVSKWGFILVGAALLFVSGFAGIGAFLLILGQIVGRYLFYAVGVDPRVSLN